MNIVQICFEPMFSRISKGGGLEMRRRLNALTRFGFKIKSYSYSKQSSEGDIRESIILRNRPRLNEIYLPYPVLTRRYSQTVLDEITANISGKGVILIEGLQAAHIVAYMSDELLRRTIIRIHNWESQYHFQMAQGSNGVKKILHNITGYQYRLFEDRIIRRIYHLAHISYEEQLAMSIRYPYIDYGVKHHLCRPICNPFIRFEYDDLAEMPDALVIMGDLTIPGNMSGTIRFIEDIWEKLHKMYPSIKLYIIGLGSETITRHSGVEPQGYIDNLEDFFKNKNFLQVVPILFGGGVKIKTIDILASGIPSIFSVKAMEGIETKEFNNLKIFDLDKIQDTLDKCIESIEEYKLLSMQSKLNRDIALESYSEEKFISQFTEILKDLK